MTTAAFPPMCAANTALAIVDMQRGYLDPDQPCCVPAGRGILGSLSGLLEGCREAAVPVVHIITVWQRDAVDRSRFTTSDSYGAHDLRHGRPSTEIVPELAPLDTEYVLHKKRYSGFYMTELELLLRSLGTTYLVVAGVATNFCVRATVHDAAFRDLLPVVPDDCTASFTVEEHSQSLKDIAKGFGWVRSSDEILSLLKRRGEDRVARNEVGAHESGT